MAIEKADQQAVGRPEPRRTYSFEEVAGICLMVAISLTMGIGVFFRYVLNDSLSWTEEVSRYGLVYVTFIGCSLAVRNQSHIRIDFIDNLLPGKARSILKITNDMVCLCFFVYMGYKAYQIMWILHTTKSTALQLPMSYLYMVIFVGFALSSFRLVSSYVHKIRSVRME